MINLRTWSHGDPEPYSWPGLHDHKERKWVSCPAGWHLDQPNSGGDLCVGWATLTKLHGPLTEEPSPGGR